MSTEPMSTEQSSSLRMTSTKNILTKEQKEDLKVSFDLFDKDGSGKIDVAELKAVMLRFGHRLTDTELKELIKSVDKDDDKEINFNEFVLLMEIKGMKYDPDAELRLAFNTIDSDGNGTISVQELKDLMKKTNQQVSDADFDTLMKSIDTNHDEVLDFDEFKALMSF